MKRYEMIKNQKDFSNIIHNGNYKKNKYFVLYNMPSNEIIPKFGIAVGKKIGNAVIRNKIKRQIRMILTNHKNLFKNNIYYIIIVKRGAVELSYSDIETNILNLIKGD